jgi:hypothetical protein
VQGCCTVLLSGYLLVGGMYTRVWGYCSVLGQGRTVHRCGWHVQKPGCAALGDRRKAAQGVKAPCGWYAQ